MKFKELGDSGFYTLSFKNEDQHRQTALYDANEKGFVFNLSGFTSQKKARALARAILKETD